MARICAECRQPLDQGRDRDHVCLDEDAGSQDSSDEDETA
jgi:hypothetical protein